MANNDIERSKKLLLKTIGASTVILVFALGLLGYASLYSKQRLAIQTAEFMAQNKLRGDMFSFEDRIAQGETPDNKTLDDFSRDFGVVATVFVRESNDFRRTATTVKDALGNRASGTFLGTNNKAYQSLMSGGVFFGNTVIFDKNYIVLYKPVYSKENQDITGALFLGMEKSQVEEYIDKNSSTQTLVSIIIGVFLLLLVILANAISINVIIIKPISKITDILRDISEGEGDLTQKLPMKSDDEVGMLARFFNKLMDTLKNPISDTKAAVSSLATSAEELSSVSSRLSSSSEESSANANEVAGAAEQMSVNINTVSAAVEEMSASIRQIATNTSDVRQIATKATGKAADATGAMGKLGAAAKEIGKVTDVIKKIADKTNLLALNATIEAASAGDAGKGFAVVASEIKELANQSATSADDIAKRIEGIQSGTADAVNVIKDVSGIIENIHFSVETIATHVDQQTKASNEIANNVAQANVGAKKVAESISEIAIGCRESSEGSSLVHSSASDLQKISSKLQAVMGKFKV